MDYSFRLLFAFVSMRRSRQAHFSFCGFFSTAYACTCTQHDDTFQQEEYQPADWKMLTKKNFQRPELRHVHIRPALKSALKIALSLNFQFEQNRA